MITTGQAAERLGVNAETIRRMIKSGRLKAINLAHGRGTRDVFRIDENDLNQFIAESVIKADNHNSDVLTG